MLHVGPSDGGGWSDGYASRTTMNKRVTTNGYTSHMAYTQQGEAVYAEILPVMHSPLHSHYGNTDTWINPAFNGYQNAPVVTSMQNQNVRIYSNLNGDVKGMHSQFGFSPSHTAFNMPVHQTASTSHTVNSPAHSMHGTPAHQTASPAHSSGKSSGRSMASSTYSSSHVYGSPAHSVNSPAHSASSSNSSSNAAVSFFARAAQKFSRKRKKKDPEPADTPQSSSPMFLTNFKQVLSRSPPMDPPNLLRTGTRLIGNNKVKVILRISPVVGHPSGSSTPGNSGHYLQVDPSKKLVILHNPSASYTTPSQRRSGELPRRFEFDGVITQDDSMEELCSQSLVDIIQSVVAGADGCVFCYGHARLGKTYTMLGTDDGPKTLGIIPSAIWWLYRLIEEQKRRQTGARFSVRVSAVEITGKQESLKDLLANAALGSEHAVDDSPGIYLREDPIRGTQLENVCELRSPTAVDAAHYLDAAITARTTPQQDEDARNSHLLFTFHVYQYRMNTPASGPAGEVAGGRSRLHLLDLGSCSRSSRDGMTLSLAAVGNILLALFRGQRQIPSRDSKLTQLIKESLGSSTCRTCMIAHVSSSAHSYVETLGVMQLAAKIHRTKPRKIRLYPSSSDESSSADSVSMRRYRGIRMGTMQEPYSLSDPSSSEMSCDTVIYVGPHGRALSDHELTDNERPPSSPSRLALGKSPARLLPRTVPNLNRSKSHSGDESSDAEKLSIVSKSSGESKLHRGGKENYNLHLGSPPPSVLDGGAALSPNGCVLPPYIKPTVFDSSQSSPAVTNSQQNVRRQGRRFTGVTASEQWIDGPLIMGKLQQYTIPEEPDTLTPGGAGTQKEECWVDGPAKLPVHADTQEVAVKQTSDLSTQTVLSATKLNKLKEHAGVDSLKHLPRPPVRPVNRFVTDWLEKHSGMSSDEEIGRSRSRSKPSNGKEPEKQQRSSSVERTLAWLQGLPEDTAVTEPTIDDITMTMDDVIANIDDELQKPLTESVEVCVDNSIPTLSSMDSSEEILTSDVAAPKRSKSDDRTLANNIITNLFLSNRESVYELRFDEQLEASQGSLRNSFHSEDDSWSTSSLLKECAGLKQDQADDMETVHSAVNNVQVPPLDSNFRNQLFESRNQTMESAKTAHSQFHISTIDSGNCTQTENSFATMESTKLVNHDTSTGISTLDSQKDIETMYKQIVPVYTATTKLIQRSTLRCPDGASNPNLFSGDPTKSPPSARSLSKVFQSVVPPPPPPRDTSPVKPIAKTSDKSFFSKSKNKVSEGKVKKPTGLPTLHLRPSGHYSDPFEALVSHSSRSAKDAKSTKSGVTSKTPSESPQKRKLSFASKIPLCPGGKTKESPSPPHSTTNLYRSNKYAVPVIQSSTHRHHNCDSDSGIDSGIREYRGTRAQPRGVSLLSASSGHYSDCSSAVSQFSGLQRPLSSTGSRKQVEICAASSGYESTAKQDEGLSSSNPESPSDVKPSTTKKKTGSKQSKSSLLGNNSQSAPSSSVASPARQAWPRSTPLHPEIVHYEIEDVRALERRRPDEVASQRRLHVEKSHQTIAKLKEERKVLQQELGYNNNPSSAEAWGSEGLYNDMDLLNSLEKEVEALRKRIDNTKIHRSYMGSEKTLNKSSFGKK